MADHHDHHEGTHELGDRYDHLKRVRLLGDHYVLGAQCDHYKGSRYLVITMYSVITVTTKQGPMYLVINVTTTKGPCPPGLHEKRGLREWHELREAP